MISRDEIPKIVQAARNLIAEPEHHCTGSYATDWLGVEVCWWDEDAERFCVSGAIRRALWEHAGCPMLRDDDWWLDVHEDSEIAIDTDRVMRFVEDVVNPPRNLPTTSDRDGHAAILRVLDEYLSVMERVARSTA